MLLAVRSDLDTIQATNLRIDRLNKPEAHGISVHCLLPRVLDSLMKGLNVENGPTEEDLHVKWFATM